MKSSQSFAGRTRARLCAGAAAALLVGSGLVWPAPALAAAPGPDKDYELRANCIDSLARPATVANGVSWGQRALEYTAAWQFSRGAGETVAVIDTGVNPGPAFGSRLSSGADLVQKTSSGAGLSDCDGHGTLVAGLIAASPDPKSGFTGVAPEARIVSIRQSSANFAERGSNSTGGGSLDAPGAGTVGSLARAVDFAASVVRARVINISLANCQPAGNADNGSLTAAVRDAVERYDAVVVSAAGNLSSNGGCSKQNTPGKAPVTAAAPADIEMPGVLAVGSIGADGAPSSFSLAGSWVDLAAPGTSVISTNPYPNSSGQVNKITTQQGSGSIQGTSFSAPYVSGVVALVRARYPKLSAGEVTQLMERTASHPAAVAGRDDYIGYGLVDPVAALSDPQVAGASPAAEPRALPVATDRTTSSKSKRVALFGGLGVAAVLLVFLIGTQTMRARRARSGERSG